MPASAPKPDRRDPKRCPVCLALLPKNDVRTRLQRQCTACGSHPSQGKLCARCRGTEIWENRQGAACRTCGAHGRKADVILKMSAEGR
jgi:hypothetical protein